MIIQANTGLPKSIASICPESFGIMFLNTKLLYRKLDRSRRATNQENYNPDGTAKKKKTKWNKSKRYRKLQLRHQEICRKASENRHYAIKEDINHLRSIGDVFATEPKNAAKLAKKAKPSTEANSQKPKRRKRFGKSIKNRCPGFFQAQANQKFTSTGGKYIEVPSNYRASQYDHTADDYIQKKLSQRMYNLSDGTLVQRDWYSSFLLYCADSNDLNIDKEKCILEFEEKYKKEQNLIDRIRTSRKAIMNSGIKPA